MRRYKEAIHYVDGTSMCALLKCEHCMNIQEQTQDIPVADVVCTRCRMTTDKE
jgi:hypothetical protein